MAAVQTPPKPAVPAPVQRPSVVAASVRREQRVKQAVVARWLRRLSRPSS